MEMETNELNIQELSKKGYALLKENKAREALDYFCRILNEDPNNNYALVGAGDACRKMSAFDDARDYYQRCLECHPSNSYALFGLADVYKSLNQYRKAIEVWERYLEHDEKNVTVLTRVADSYRKLHDLQNSRRTYLKVLEIEEMNPYAIIGLGHLHYDFKEYREALFYWEKMVSRPKKPVDKRVLTSIGNCHRKLKNFADGIPYFERALEMEQTNFYSLFGLADCYRGLNQSRKSLEYWNRILEQDQRNKVILTRAGDAYCNIGEYDKATEYYHRALDIEFDVYAVLGLAVVAKHEGRLDEAIDSLERLVAHDPKNYRSYIELADCYLLKHQKDRAIEVLREFTSYGIRNNRVTELLETLTM
jgi:tetratricopeptide (TPR) repeat protein